MNTLLQTAAFTDWLHDLKDPVGRARVLLRLRAMETRHFGDAAAVGDGVSELRIPIFYSSFPKLSVDQEFASVVSA